MKHVALVIGHGPELDKGAENRDGTNELDWNRKLVLLIAEELVGKLNYTIVHRHIERIQPVREVNEIAPDFALEFHLNSYNTAASGTEMIYFPGSRLGKRLAELMQQAAVRVLGLTDRGIKYPQGGGRGMPLLRGTRCPCIIVESFFIDNSHDLSVGNSRIEELAKAYAVSLVKFADELA
jgi:N-acetylmuramoyl-L-alanine amidase